jgi:hypothetical protein
VRQRARAGRNASWLTSADASLLSGPVPVLRAHLAGIPRPGPTACLLMPGARIQATGANVADGT